MTPEKVEDIISKGEGQHAEFKKSFAEENKAIESLCAFANAEGGTVMMTPDGADTIQTAMITDGNTAKFGPKFSISQWRDI